MTFLKMGLLSILLSTSCLINTKCLNESTSCAVKQRDPVAWDMAKGEHISSLEEGEQIFESAGNYYWIRDIERLF